MIIISIILVIITLIHLNITFTQLNITIIHLMIAPIHVNITLIHYPKVDRPPNPSAAEGQVLVDQVINPFHLEHPNRNNSSPPLKVSRPLDLLQVLLEEDSVHNNNHSNHNNQASHSMPLSLRPRLRLRVHRHL